MDTSDHIEDAEVKAFLQLLLERFHTDFTNYSRAFVERRLVYALKVLRAPDLRGLEEKILSDSETFEKLLKVLTVPTSEMFRDAFYFQFMRNEVLPYLSTFSTIKIWIAGCSTGEEIYSFAIMLDEEGLLERSLIYATDINLQSLKKAEAGIFPIRNIPLYTRNYQRAGGKQAFSDYYHTNERHAIFDKRLRTRVVFADHSLATDSVFTEVQLVSCRNVMIYFDQRLQNRAIGLFYDSLVRGGVLGLGNTENINFSEHGQLFDVLGQKERIYRKKISAKLDEL